MSDLNLTSFSPLYPLRIHPYQEFFNDQNANVMDRINSIIDYLNQVGKLTNDVVKDWNTVYQWVMNDGLTTDVSNKLETMLANHEFDSLISTIVTLVGDLTTLTTSDKTTIVNAINSLKSEVNTNTSQLAESVKKNDQKVFDILSTPVSYYTSLDLPQGKIMQGFYFAQNGKYLFANWADGATPESFTIYRLTVTGKVLDSMVLSQFGHGTVLGIEDVETDTYIWSNMGESDTTNTLVRFKYVAGATYTSASPEITSYSNFGNGESVYPSVSNEYIILCRNLGTGNSWRVEKRNLADVKNGIDAIVNQITIPTSNLWMQGFAVDGDNLYWYTGDTNGTNYPQKITIYSLLSGSEVTNISLDFGESTKGTAEENYKEPEGIFLYTDSLGAKSLFVGVTTGSSVTFYNKIFAYHSILNANKFLGYKLQDVPINNNPDWITADYKNGAVTYWSYPLQYRKITGGKVQLRGCVGGFTTGAVIATLPFEYKPRKMQRRMVAGDGSTNPSRVSIDNGTGDISVSLGTSVTTVWLDLEFDINP
jgi:hypothetical protein